MCVIVIIIAISITECNLCKPLSFEFNNKALMLVEGIVTKD